LYTLIAFLDTLDQQLQKVRNIDNLFYLLEDRADPVSVEHKVLVCIRLVSAGPYRCLKVKYKIILFQCPTAEKTLRSRGNVHMLSMHEIAR
jgi:hypothetical protein